MKKKENFNLCLVQITMLWWLSSTKDGQLGNSTTTLLANMSAYLFVVTSCDNISKPLMRTNSGVDTQLALFSYCSGFFRGPARVMSCIYQWLMTTSTQIPGKYNVIPWYFLTLRIDKHRLNAPLNWQVPNLPFLIVRQTIHQLCSPDASKRRL